MKMILFIYFRFSRQRQYPEVKFLTYKDRKRVLVCYNLLQNFH
jgi:hypothetical protein